jgi:hypothetical protein
MDGIEKLDNVTWCGHCVIHVMAALNDLLDEAKLTFCWNLERFIGRQQRHCAMQPSRSTAMRYPFESRLRAGTPYTSAQQNWRRINCRSNACASQ